MDPQDVFTRRETYNRKIQEQETLGKNLRERQKMVRDSQGPNMKQMKMWKDVLCLLETKNRLAASGVAAEQSDLRGEVHNDEERLVL